MYRPLRIRALAGEATGSAVTPDLRESNSDSAHDEDARAKGWIGEDGFHANEAGAMIAAEALAAAGFELNERPG